MRTVESLGEFGLIERLSRLLPSAPFVLDGIGDDCAVIRSGDRQLLATCDLSIEGVHFRRETMSGADIGWKSAVSSLSDIAAMGGIPLFGLVGLACPPDTELRFLQDVYGGISNALTRFGSLIVGGDTTRNPERIILDITMIGQTHGQRYLRRRGAQEGDLLAVTGCPGMAAAGLHAMETGLDAPEMAIAQQRPKARIPEGQWLCARPDIHAMLDVSDGVIQDAGHLASASGLGINILSRQLPAHPCYRDFCVAQGLDAIHLALGGGEDYELLFAISSAHHERVLQDFHHEFRTEVTIIGLFTSDWAGVRVDGRSSDVRGFEHFRTERDEG